MNEKEYIECPFCGEEIRVNAKKCKHCGEWLSKDDEIIVQDDEKDEGELARNKGMNIVVNPNIVVQNHNEINQEQNVMAGGSDGGESANGCLWTQIGLVAVGLGFAFHGFWFGVAAFILLGIAIFIPYLGLALCVILGAGFGLVAGILAASLGAATWIAWLIGIVSTIGLVTWNLEQRKSEQ